MPYFIWITLKAYDVACTPYRLYVQRAEFTGLHYLFGEILIRKYMCTFLPELWLDLILFLFIYLVVHLLIYLLIYSFVF